jgi:hypothetical protein
MYVRIKKALSVLLPAKKAFFSIARFLWCVSSPLV